jgi:hypothetical protein
MKERIVATDAPAPDLLATLKIVQDHIHIAMHEMDPHKQDTALMDAFDACRAAIARAADR